MKKNTSSPPTDHISLLTELDIYLFKSGKHFRLYEKLGSHMMEHDGQKGTYFAVWAPNAKAVSVVGDFNSWAGKTHPCTARWDGSGIWEAFIPGIGQGALYKYQIKSYNGFTLTKGDPFARYWQLPPDTASIVWETDYKWKDKKWLEARKTKAGQAQPYSVYEVHLASWKTLTDKPNQPLSYAELADQLVAYVKQMGFTHVELMPVMEHPYSPSWGYQITGYFAAGSRFGKPEGLMALIDAFHQAGIGVILDWVPSHFPTDAHGLAQFDGTYLFEHEDPRKGFHPDWKSAIFNYGRNEVRSFLISNALFWLEKYHADGLRVDAVASMIYLDYSREEGQWIPNEYGGNENLEAISFLREFNETVYKEFPDTITIAEESTAFGGVSRPTYTGGLGFGQKWMMGWMHDILNFLSRDTVFRKYHHGELHFSLVYAFSENFMLPLSHDEVVHGKASLINKMPGDEWQRFANLRLLYGFMYMHPGTQLLFMGGEFGQTSEWNFQQGLNWWLLQYDFHRGLQSWVQQLNHFYKNHPALYQLAFSPEGFEWIDYTDWENTVLTFLRKGDKDQKPLLVVCNFSPKVIENYKIGLPFMGQWVEVINSDSEAFGGSHVVNEGKLKVVKGHWHQHGQHLVIRLAPLAVMVFEPTRKLRRLQAKTKKAVDKKKTITTPQKWSKKNGAAG